LVAHVITLILFKSTPVRALEINRVLGDPRTGENTNGQNSDTHDDSLAWVVETLQEMLIRQLCPWHPAG